MPASINGVELWANIIIKAERGLPDMSLEYGIIPNKGIMPPKENIEGL